MNILAVDDEKNALEGLESALRRALPNADIHSFRTAADALEFAGHTTCAVAFLDIELRDMNGLELAKRLKDLHGDTNIVFVTGYSEYAIDAFDIHASGYLLKPVTVEKVLDAMQNLRTPLHGTEKTKRVRIQCFGNFEIFVDGVPLRFTRKQTKELLALLVDRKGAILNTEQICAILFEDATDVFQQKSKLRKLISDLSRTLREVNAEFIFLKQRNSFAIAVEELSCDYYDFLLSLPSGVNAYMGEYMSQYSWAEMTLATLGVGVETPFHIQKYFQKESEILISGSFFTFLDATWTVALV